MSTTAQVTVTAIADDTSTEVQRMSVSTTVDPVLSVNGQRQTVAISSGWNALTVPTGANLVMIRVLTGAVTLTLKGVTGDTGVVIQSGTLTDLPVLLPLGTTPSLGIAANGSATLDVMYL